MLINLRDEEIALTLVKNALISIQMPRLNYYYDKAVEQLPENTHAWFMYGQAEKVFIGACHAAMYRSIDSQSVATIASIFGLSWRKIGEELWIYRNEVAALMEKLEQLPEGTEDVVRGMLCGVRDIKADWSKLGGDK